MGGCLCVGHGDLDSCCSRMEMSAMDLVGGGGYDLLRRRWGRGKGRGGEGRVRKWAVAADLP